MSCEYVLIQYYVGKVCGTSVVRLLTLSHLHNAVITCKQMISNSYLPPFGQGFEGAYVIPSVWTAAESSITVVSACLPSLGPLFARVLWRRARQPTAKSQLSHKSPTASWECEIWDTRPSAPLERYRGEDEGDSGDSWTVDVS